MTGSAECRDIRHALGVYVLGAIDPAERTVVDQHLATCPDCREELASLAGLPALLRRVPVGEAEQLASGDPDLADADLADDRMLQSLLDRTGNVRRLRRWRGLAAAAAVIVVAAVGGAAGWGALHGAGHAGAGVPAAAARWDSASATNPQTNVAATVRYAATNWGTAVDTQIKGAPAGTRCELEVTDAAGHTSVVGGWTASYDEGTAWYPGSSAVTLDSVRSFTIVAAGKVLVTVPMH